MKSTQNQDLATERISLRCTPALKAAIISAAKSEKRSPSNWIVSELEDILKAAEKADCPETKSSLSTLPDSGVAKVSAS
jgi:uncharacterized protein (DUF1778 family)